MVQRAMLERVIDQAVGRSAADLVIRQVRLLDVITGAVTETDIAICGDRIVGTHDSYRGVREIDGRGQFAVPGFIDTHLHIESSLVTPLEFDRCVLPHGVTTAICDPHEIANVLGVEGVRYFLDSSRATVDGPARAAVLLRAGDRISRRRARGSRPPTWWPCATTPR